MDMDDIFFAQNPGRDYRIRMASASEIAALDPPPEPGNWVYAVITRCVNGYGIFECDAAPRPGELDDETTARELWQGLCRIGDEVT